MHYYLIIPFVKKYFVNLSQWAAYDIFCFIYIDIVARLEGTKADPFKKLIGSVEAENNQGSNYDEITLIIEFLHKNIPAP